MRAGPGAWLDGLVQRAAGDAGGFALTRGFAATSALAIAAFSGMMGGLIGGFLESRMLERDAAVGRDFVQSVANIQQVAGFFEQPGASPAPSVEEFFAHVAAMPDVIRANVYAPDRRVLWSSRAELIGRTFPANDELDEALDGRVVVHRGDDDGDGQDKAEHQGLDRRRDEYVENYLPVFDPAHRRLIGVIELYRRPAALLAAIREGRQRVWGAAAGGGLALFAVLVWFVRRTEQALREQRRRLVDAEALAIVGEIAAAVAHSIRNPLGSIRSSAELQLELHGEDGEHGAVHGETVRHVDRIEHLVRTLLSYAADPSERAGSSDLAAVVGESAQRFEPDLRARGTRLELRLDARLGRVAADPVVLAQIFNSLLANAAEATREGDRIVLAAQRRGDRVELRVEDSGGGIDAEQLPHVFRPFYTRKPRGLGMGLPLARRIVQRLGGSIAVDSAAGRGTTVTLTLPVSDA